METKIKHLYKREQVALDSNDINYLASNKDKLDKLGIGASQQFLDKFSKSKLSLAMDAGFVQPVQVQGGGTPVQFLQEFLTGAVHVLTTVRRADSVAPVAIAGQWWQEEVVLKTLEHTAFPQLYSDHGGVTFASFTEDYARRQIVRVSMGIQNNPLADARSDSTGTSSANEKRAALALGFETLRNEIAFYGFNVGSGKTYGILNDPNLPAYVTVPQGVSGTTTWEEKTASEIVSDLSTAFKALEIQSGGNVDTVNEVVELLIPLGFNHELTKTDSSLQNGNKTAMDWLSDNYPKCKVITIPEFTEADSGENVFYLKAISVDNSGTDGGEAMIQVVPEKMTATNTVDNIAGGSDEGYRAAYAGVFVKRPYAVYRATGI